MCMVVSAVRCALLWCGVRGVRGEVTEGVVAIPALHGA